MTKHLVSENDSPVKTTEPQSTDASQEEKEIGNLGLLKYQIFQKKLIYTSDSISRSRILGNRQHHSKHWALQDCKFEIKKENASNYGFKWSR